MPYFIVAAFVILYSQRKVLAVRTADIKADITNQWERIALITKYDPLYREAATKYGLDWKMLKAISMIESWQGTYKGVIDTPEEQALAPNKADSSDQLSSGLMQITLKTALDLDPQASFKKLQDPRYSVMLAAQYIKEYIMKLAPNSARRQEFIVKSYNQGAGNTKREFAGKSQGFASVYWERYQKAYGAIT